MMLARTRFSGPLLAALLAGGTFLATPTVAEAAMSCDQIMDLVDYNVPTSVILDSMASSGTEFDDRDIECLIQRGAPPEVVAKAREMKAPEAPEPQAVETAPVPQEERRSRFEDTEALGDDLPDDIDEDAMVDAGGCSDLDRYIRDYKAQKYLTSSYGLFGMLEQNTCPQKESTVYYYLAKSMHALEMYHSAQHYYLEVVRKGPSNPLFRHALPRLAAIASYTGNDYELLRVVGKIAPESYPRQARPHLYYLMGRKSYEGGELSEAAAQFEQVPTNHPLYPRAQYFQGIINYERSKLKSAVKSFREVIRSEVPLQIEDPALVEEIENLKDLSILNIGRIYFGLQRFENADKYYSKVERDSVYWPQSLFERAWSDFYEGDLNSALGLLLTVDSPYYTEADFIPETSYLRSLTYFQYCEYQEVERNVALFKARYQPIRSELKGFLEQYTTDEGRKLTDRAFDTYFGERAGDSDLPVSLFMRVLRNRDLASLVRHMDMMDEEIDEISTQKAQWRDSLGEHLTKVIEKDRVRYKRRAGRAFLQEILEQYRMLDQLLQDFDVLEFEVADAQRADYMFKAQNPDADAFNEGPIDFATRTDIIYWPFNGEFWADELAYYRYTEQGSCN